MESDWTYANQLITLIESTWDQVSKAVASGADLEATRKAVNLDSFRPTFGGKPARAIGFLVYRFGPAED